MEMKSLRGRMVPPPIPMPSATRDLMVRYSGVWFFLKITDADMRDRLKWNIWNQLPGERYTDGLPSFESEWEMKGIAQERTAV